MNRLSHFIEVKYGNEVNEFVGKRQILNKIFSLFS
jgi:hypothetical protein